MNRIQPLVKEYNELLLLLPRDPGAIPLDPLPTDLKELNDISLDDQLWQFETSRITAKWAIHPQIRSAIAALDKNERALEEVEILTCHAENFMDWAMGQMNAFQDMIFYETDVQKPVQLDSLVGRRILKLAMKTADSLRTLGLLEKVSLDWVVPENKRSDCVNRLQG
jgi:hypothetical protein